MAFDFDNHRVRTFSRRMVLLTGVQGLLLLGLLSRHSFLGIWEQEKYKTLSDKNRFSIRFLAPPRGLIVDRHGAVLAENRKDFQVQLVPESASDVSRTLSLLATILNLSDEDTDRIKKRIKSQPVFIPVIVSENLDWTSFARINAHLPELPGVMPVEEKMRFYPDGAGVGHLVGYVDVANAEEAKKDPMLHLPGFHVGKQGLEKSFDSLLRGEVGVSRIEVNAFGRTVREVTHEEGRQGTSLALTVDGALQRFAAERLADVSGSAVVLDARSGDVLAAVSAPSFDPNTFTQRIKHEDWQALLQDPKRPLVNKFLAGQYAPGSTIKMAVALAALEAGVIDEQEVMTCRGKISLGDTLFHCWRPEGHGSVTLIDAIARSCNVFFYEVAKRVGPERMAAMARRLGLGETFKLDLQGQRTGLVPTPMWKRQTQGARWSLGETLVVGIGQGAYLATPLQLAVMAARLANGYKAVTPRLVQSISDAATTSSAFADLHLDPRHLEIVRQGMRGVLEPGGTAALSRLTGAGMSMAGKTGSSQVRRISKAERDAPRVDQMSKPWEERDHGIFVAYAPVEAPRYALGVVVEHGGGGARSAAPVGRDIMRKLLELEAAAPAAPRALPVPSSVPKIGRESSDG